MNLDKILTITSPEGFDIKQLEGKNLFPVPFLMDGTSGAGLTYTTNGGDITIVGTKTATGEASYYPYTAAGPALKSLCNYIGETVTVKLFKTNLDTTEINPAMDIWKNVGGTWTIVQSIAVNASKTFVVPEADDFRVRIYFGQNLTGQVNCKVNIQCEKGNTSTEYEPYVCYWKKPTSTSTTEGISEKVMSAKSKSLRVDELYGDNVNVNQLCYSIDATTTYGGITWTNNGDGSVTATGTASGTSRVVVSGKDGSITTVTGHKYFLTGCPIGGSNSTYRLRFTSGDISDIGNGVVFTGSSSVLSLQCQVLDGTTVSHLVFRPQLIDLTQMFGAGNEPDLATCKKIFGEYKDNPLFKNDVMSNPIPNKTGGDQVTTITDTANKMYICTVNGLYAGAGLWFSLTYTSGHYYYVTMDTWSEFDTTLQCHFANYLGEKATIPANTWTTTHHICKHEGSALELDVNTLNTEIGKTFKHKNIKIFDLTSLFGSGKEPTLDECKKIFAEPKVNYIPYTKGFIQGNDVDKVEITTRDWMQYNNINYALTGPVTNQGVTYEKINPYTYRIYGTTTINNHFYNLNYSASTNLCGLIPNHIYYSRRDPKSKACFRVFYFDTNGTDRTFITYNGLPVESVRKQFTDTHNGTTWCRLQLENYTVGDYVDDVCSPMLIDLTKMFGAGNEPSQAECDELFKLSTTTTINIPDTIKDLDGYGWSAGNVKNSISWENGQCIYTKRVGRVDPSTLTYSYVESSELSYCRSVVDPIGLKAIQASEMPNILFVGYIAGARNSDVPGRLSVTSGGHVNFSFEVGKYANVDEFKASIAGKTLYYELATPIVYYINPQMWTAGNISNYIDSSGYHIQVAKHTFTNNEAIASYGVGWTISPNVYKDVKRDTLNISFTGYTPVRYTNVYYGNTDKSVAIHDNQYGVRIYDSTFTTAADVQKAITGRDIYYELENPITIPLTNIKNIDNFNLWFDVSENSTVKFIDDKDNLCFVNPDSYVPYTGYDTAIFNKENGYTASGNCLIGFPVKVEPNTLYEYSGDYTKVGGNNIIWRIREYSDYPTDWQPESFIRQTMNDTRDVSGNYHTTFVTTSNTKWVLVAQYFNKETGTGGDYVEHIQLQKAPTIISKDDFTDGYHLDSVTGLPVIHDSRIATLNPVDVSNMDKVIVEFSGTNRTPALIYSLFKDNTLISRVAGSFSGTVLDVSNGTKLYLSLYDTSGSLVIKKENMTYFTINEVPNLIKKTDFIDGLSLNNSYGTWAPNETRCMSNLITLHPGTYTITQGESGYWKACTYNYDTGAWIKSLFDTTSLSYTFTITEKCNIRVGFDRTIGNVSTVSLTSTNIVKYIPYKAPIQLVTNVKDTSYVGQ